MIEHFFWKFIGWIAGTCEHEWAEYHDNSMKRRCYKCGRVEWLFTRRFPAAGEAAYEWKVME